MKERMLGFVSTAFYAALLTGCTNGTGSVSSVVGSAPGVGKGQEFSIYTSFYTMQNFAKKIGGDKVTVIDLVPPGMGLRDWKPQSSGIVGLENADVFIYNGAGVEHWADNVLDSLQNGELVVVEASSGTSLLERASEREDEESPVGENAEEEESSTDPHAWLSLLDVKEGMENIKSAFIQADPANQETYEANYSKCAAQADELDGQFRKMTGELKNRDLIVAHQAFGYLCKEYGSNQVTIEGLSAGSEPDAAKMTEIVGFAKEHKITIIFFGELVNPKVAQTITKTTGAKTAVLDPIEEFSDENKTEGLDYFSIMEKSLETIREASSG